MTFSLGMLAGALLLLGVGCGARSELEGLDAGLDAGGERGRDAGPRRRDAGAGRDAGAFDGGGLDAGSLDAGTPCLWRQLVAPIDVFREPVGRFSRPEVVRMDADTVLLATYTDAFGRLSIRASSLTRDLRLVDLGTFASPPRGVGSDVVAAPSGGMVGVCVPSMDGQTYLQRHLGPTYRISSRQPLGTFDACLDASGTDERTLLGMGRVSAGGLVDPFVMHFAPAGAGFGPRRARSDPTARGPIVTTRVDEGFAWAGSTDRFGRIEVAFLVELHDAPGFVTVGGFARADASAPALAQWPHAPRAVAVVGSGVGLRLAVVADTGRELLRNDALAFQMFPTPVPAMASSPDGLLIAQLDFGDLDPRSGRISVSEIGADGVARNVGRGPFGVSRAEENAGAEVAADGDPERVVVHWSSSVSGPGVVEETRTHVLAFECE